MKPSEDRRLRLGDRVLQWDEGMVTVIQLGDKHIKVEWDDGMSSIHRRPAMEIARYYGHRPISE